MKIIRIYRAQGDIEPVTIEIHEPLPELADDGGIDAWLAVSGERFDQQAKAIVDALFASLPGGTLDRVLVEMLRRTASHLVVSYQELKERRDDTHT